MQNFKISLITVCFNAENTIGRCIESVIGQDFQNLEYIIIDGGSTDKTCEVIKKYKKSVDIFVSEGDNGIYDAMNKGVRIARGDIIGTLNADDYFAAKDILSIIADEFSNKCTDITYGDLDYVDANGLVIRRWRSRQYYNGAFRWGWMPPHPTFYCKKDLLKNTGLYSLHFGSAADYELMLRIMSLPGLKIKYLKKVVVKMQIGGISNKSITNRLKALKYDLKAMQKNGLPFPLLTLILKPLRKIFQYL